MPRRNETTEHVSVATPLLNEDNEPAFREGWHAQVLAVANNLIATGHFTANEWTTSFAATLRSPDIAAQADELDAYYKAVLSTLEALLNAKTAIPQTVLDDRTETWRRAYLNTPHGKPVELEAGHADVLPHTHHDHHHH